jgi:predicted HTH transcriptional regulator
MAFDLDLALNQGESQTLEFRENIVSPEILARNLSAFSNTDGGTIIVGIREPNQIVGTSEDRLKGLFEAALGRTTGPIQAQIEFQEIEGKKVGLIHVQKSAELVGSSSGFFVREGQRTRKEALSSEEILRAARASASTEKSLATLSDTVSKQSAEISKMSNELRKLNSWPRKFFWICVGGVVGAVAKEIISSDLIKAYITSLMMSIIPAMSINQ